MNYDSLNNYFFENNCEDDEIFLIYGHYSAKYPLYTRNESKVKYLYFTALYSIFIWITKKKSQIIKSTANYRVKNKTELLIAVTSHPKRTVLKVIRIHTTMISIFYNGRNTMRLRERYSLTPKNQQLGSLVPGAAAQFWMTDSKPTATRQTVKLRKLRPERTFRNV